MIKKGIHSILFLLSTIVAHGQIEYTFNKVDAHCHNSNDGEIDINVTPTNPPYSYSWSNGATTDQIVDLAPGNYTVVIVDGLGNDTTVTIRVIEIPCGMDPELVFTPNGDGINDTWFIANTEYYPNATFLVYNRLGQKVFEKKGLYEPWDGKDIFGTPLPDNSYFYVVQSEKTSETVIKGTVNILR